jgi:glycosyltransferase 2 family protein
MSAVGPALPASPSPLRRYGILALKIIVSVALLELLLRRVDVAGLWATARRASLTWLAVAMALYLLTVLVGVWRWHILLTAQHVAISPRTLLGSALVANFFNNFLPSNIGGDVIRISDSAKAAKSKTLATTVVLVDRGMGVMALVLVAATGATFAGRMHPAAIPIWPVWLWAGFLLAVAASAPAVLAPDGFGRLLRPLTVFHPEWVGGRIAQLTGVLGKFRNSPGALVTCFIGAVVVQGTLVLFYFAVSYALHLDVTLADLAVIVPISLVVQMLPVSLSGFGVRETTFAFYFTRIGHPVDSAVLMSLVAQALIILASLAGGGVYVARGHARPDAV